MIEESGVRRQFYKLFVEDYKSSEDRLQKVDSENDINMKVIADRYNVPLEEISKMVFWLFYNN